ncbi:MAG: D-alanyl-D-alanine carboxypeptidase [Protaetiibacter sp.]
MSYRGDPSDGVGRLSEIMRAAHEEELRAPEPGDPAARRRRRRRGWIATGIVVAVLLAAVGGYAGWALTAPLPAATGDATPPTAQPGPVASIVLPVDGAYALSVAGGEELLGPDGAGLSTVSADDVQPMASITKVITALVILNAKPLAGPDDPGPTITFSKADHELYDAYYVRGATIAAMPTGSTMSLHDALEMMLVISATNYADAVSTWAFGSRSAFLRATKDWLAANGFTRTAVVEPTGLDPGSVSTPSELIALGKLAMANPVIASIVAMPSLDVPGFEGQGNTNTLLGVDGIRGVKTGTLDTANLLFSSQLDGGIGEPLELTGVVLGAYSRDSIDGEVRAWLDSIRAGFHEVTANESGAAIGTYTTPWGASARMVLADDATLLTWSDTPITATMTELRLTTGEKGEKVGEVTWTAGSRSRTVAVVLDQTIRPPDEWWRLTHPLELAR